MELFSLLAKLTLDSSEFDKKIQSAEQSVKGIKVDEPVLTLDDSDFTEKIHNAQMESVDDMTGENAPELDLDKEDFDKGMDSAQDEKVDDMTGENAPNLGLDTEEFNKGVEDATAAGKTFAGGMTETFEGIKKALVATGIVTLITGITNLITDAVNKTTEMADTIDKQSTVLGISKTKYQEWDHALKQSGGSVSELSRGAIKFRTLLDDVNKELEKGNSDFDFRTMTVEEQALKMKDLEIMTEEQSDAFRKLGISVLDANGHIKTSEQLMEDALVATSELSGDAQLKVINDLFGRNVQGITNLVAGGKEQVKELLGEAQELGIVLSDEEIQQAVAYGDAVANLNAELDAIKSAFVADIIPVLKDAAEWLTELLQLFNPRTRENSLTDTFDQINDATLKSGQKIDETGAKATALIEKLSGMGDYWSLDSTGQKTWDTLASEFIALEPEFEKFIDLENKAINGNTAKIKENIRAWEQREKQRLLDENTAQKREAIAKQYAAAEDKIIEAEVKEADANAARALAMEKYNDLLTSTESKYKQMQGEFAQKFGTGTVTEKNFADVEAWMMQNYRPYLADAGAITATEEWKTLSTQAEELQAKASAMIEEADKATAELEKYEEALAKRLKLTTSEAGNTTDAVQKLKRELSALPSSVPIRFPLTNIAMPKAIGDAYIPYDNYPALLHRGERVLTATEARQTNNFDIAGLEDRIEAAIRNGMDGVTVRSYLNGKEITDEVNRNTVNQVKARRFA